jgi:hypothetical protein
MVKFPRMKIIDRIKNNERAFLPFVFISFDTPFDFV